MFKFQCSLSFIFSKFSHLLMGTNCFAGVPVLCIFGRLRMGHISPCTVPVPGGSIYWFYFRGTMESIIYMLGPTNAFNFNLSIIEDPKVSHKPSLWYISCDALMCFLINQSCMKIFVFESTVRIQK